MKFSEFANQTFHHLAKQGRLSTNGRRRSGGQFECLYRGPGGTKCAIGFWIADENYHPHLENKAAVNSEVQLALPDFIRAFPREQVMTLQYLHDTAENWRSPIALLEAMKQLSSRFSFRLDDSLEAEIWANWKGAPPGELREVNTYRPERPTLNMAPSVMYWQADNGPIEAPSKVLVHDYF